MSIYLYPAVEDDIRFMSTVYNQAIDAGNCVFDSKPLTYAERKKWFDEHSDQRFPIFIIEEKGYPIGYSYLKPYRTGGTAVDHVAEIYFYLDFEYHGRKLGTELMNMMEDEARQRGFQTLVSEMLESNASGTALLQKLEYEEWGRMPALAVFGGDAVDHVIYGKNL